MPPIGHWFYGLIEGDLFILIAAISVAAGGAACALLLAGTCRAIKPTGTQGA